MNIFINGLLLSEEYHHACGDNMPHNISTLEEHYDFINAYDGCAFE